MGSEICEAFHMHTEDYYDVDCIHWTWSFIMYSFHSCPYIFTVQQSLAPRRDYLNGLVGLGGMEPTPSLVPLKSNLVSGYAPGYGPQIWFKF